MPAPGVRFYNSVSEDRCSCTFYQLIPLYSFHQFCHFLALFYQELLDDVIDIEAYLNVYTDTRSAFVASLHSMKSYHAKEMELLWAAM